MNYFSLLVLIIFSYSNKLSIKFPWFLTLCLIILQSFILLELVLFKSIFFYVWVFFLDLSSKPLFSISLLIFYLIIFIYFLYYFNINNNYNRIKIYFFYQTLYSPHCIKYYNTNMTNILYIYVMCMLYLDILFIKYLSNILEYYIYFCIIMVIKEYLIFNE